MSPLADTIACSCKQQLYQNVKHGDGGWHDAQRLRFAALTDRVAVRWSTCISVQRGDEILAEDRNGPADVVDLVVGVRHRHH